MKVEVLISAMNQTDLSLIKKSNIHSDAIIINQCDINDFLETAMGDNVIKMISSRKRGLSRSRNEALLNATGDICLLCDDDVRYCDKYVEIIKSAFNEIPDADIIVFNTDMINYSSSKKREPIKKIRRSPRHKNYGSVRMAFRLESFQKNNLWFNVNFGAGSIYSSGEESLMLREANKKGLKIYEYPAVIASVDYSNSTWFHGYNEKFFYDIGAWLEAAYPKMKHLLKYYYLITFNNQSVLTKKEIMYFINQGINSYSTLCGFTEKREADIKKILI